MEGRKVIRGFAVAARIICPRPRILVLAQHQTSMEKSSFALPIPGMANKCGRLVQERQHRRASVQEECAQPSRHRLDQAVNKYLYFEGKDTSKMSTSRPARIIIEDPGLLDPD